MLADVLSWFFVLPSLSCTICFHTAFTLKVEVAGFLKTKLHGTASWKTVIIMFIHENLKSHWPNSFYLSNLYCSRIQLPLSELLFCLWQTCFYAYVCIIISVSWKLYGCPRFMFLHGVVQHCVSVHFIWDSSEVCRRHCWWCRHTCWKVFVRSKTSFVTKAVGFLNTYITV